MMKRQPDGTFRNARQASASPPWCLGRAGLKPRWQASSAWGSRSMPSRSRSRAWGNAWRNR